ncbi:MAG: hypothetical protein EA412_02195 [Chitinophagaceae bacterium]|nr:MAG: hypothetical protein EA412_02195 [Chitinophagaceae bacterium]
MDLITRVKGSLYNLSDGRYFSAMGAEWVDVNLNPELPGFIHPKDALEIKNWLYGTSFVAGFHNNPKEEIESIIETVQPDYIQLTGEYDINWIKQLNIPVFKQISIENEMTAEELKSKIDSYKEAAEYFILDFLSIGVKIEDMEKEGSSIKINDLRQLCKENKILLKAVFTPQNILEILDSIKPEGINLVGGSEIEVGAKSFEDLNEIAEILEKED